MAHFLRDQQIANVSITEESLAQLSGLFSERLRMLNDSLAEAELPDKRAFLTYIIRFDNKGYRVFSIDDLIKYFRLAKCVERVLITVETGESLRSNRNIGTLLELRLDEKDPVSSFLTITSNDKDWVDASFAAVVDGLAKHQNGNRWVRSLWTAFGVQLVGITLGFLLSLWAATKIAPILVIENAFVFAFLFVLLVFSNSWTYLNQLLIRLLNKAFPNIKFLRQDKERLHWLLQAIVGGIVGAAVLYAIGLAASFFLDMLTDLISRNT
jgi:hypothetical protein